ncbi:MAG: hypothetical protein V4726_09070 [Verrucomicrobiota bacterium]
MSLQPDHPAFTAAALGEAPPEELAAFEAELAENGDWLAEAGTLRETAGRLTAALRQEMAATSGFLTSGQRQAVFSAGEGLQGKTASGTPPPSGETPVFTTISPATSRSPRARRPTGKFPARFGSVLATAGVAAAVALGIFAFSGPQGSQTQAPQSAGGENQTSAQAPDGISAIALDPAATAQKSGVPAPGLPVIPKKDPVLNPGSPLTAPPGSPASGSIATSTPDIRIIPAPPARTRNPEPAAEPLPGPRRSGGTPGALASPANPGGR